MPGGAGYAKLLTVFVIENVINSDEKGRFLVRIQKSVCRENKEASHRIDQCRTKIVASTDRWIVRCNYRSARQFGFGLTDWEADLVGRMQRL